MAITTEWMGKIAAIIAIALFFLVMTAIHKGLLVQSSARSIVQNFHTTNNFFATRADFNDPALAKQELQTLAGVLTQLNGTTVQDVNDLAATLPNVARLLDAGKGDVDIAKQMQGVAGTLQGSASSLHRIAGGAEGSVSTVNNSLAAAINLVGQLNAQLAITEQKLSVLPATGR
ncbi:hypothetical protein NGB36_00360 [Streptomyces sp. RB6PN25]|uniref:Uncharacterized protein n=1 Tax=Streptomyces humicola TaxID=2953240 RepID=A0ABT1PN51_9ACTN|nr:hypothetical protein [Streptomyces humicola]MCQ4079107.1 hypothetical protein [Streptomyces humicola]